MLGLLRLILLVSLLMGTSGCAAWWARFKTDPVAQVQTFESSVRTTLTIAGVVWGQVKLTIPAGAQVQAQIRYDQAVVAVTKALSALDDAVHAAADVNSATPDFGKAIQDVSDAVAQVMAIVDEFKGGAPAAQPEPVGYTHLKSAVGTVQQRAKRK